MATKKTNKGLIWGIVSVLVIGAGVGLYFLLRKPKKEEDADTSPADTGSTDKGSTNTGSGSTEQYTKKASLWSPIGTSSDKLNYTTPIVYGAKGEEVVQLQKLLNLYLEVLNKPQIKVDGDFGKTTWGIVEPLQSKAQSLKWWMQFMTTYFKELTNVANKKRAEKMVKDLQSKWFGIASFIGNGSMVYEPTSSFENKNFDL